MSSAVSKLRWSASSSPEADSKPPTLHARLQNASEIPILYSAGVFCAYLFTTYSLGAQCRRLTHGSLLEEFCRHLLPESLGHHQHLHDPR